VQPGFDIPVWLQSSTGNVNNVDDEMNDTWDGKIMLVPMFDATCRRRAVDRSAGRLHRPRQRSPTSGYHIPRFAEFLLDHAYISGNNKTECKSARRPALEGGNGMTSCLKGWFVRYVMQGPVGLYQAM
jgi:hypothetical protein